MELLPRYLGGFQFFILKKKFVLYSIVIVYTVFNVAVIVLPPVPSPLSKDLRFPGHWLLVANLIAFAIGGLWWLVITRGLERFWNIRVHYEYNGEGERRVEYEVSKV